MDYISARILDTNHPPELVLVLVQSKFAMNAATKFLNSAASLLKSISINRTITINSIIRSRVLKLSDKIIKYKPYVTTKLCIAIVASRSQMFSQQ